MTRVLVVEDEPSVRLFLEECLSGAGFSVELVDTATAAYERLRSEPPDLLLLDLGLPDLDGLDLLAMLREWSRLPVIVLSVREDEQTIVAALDAGADDYLSKPFRTSELLARLRVALRHAGGEAEEEVFKSGPLRVDLAARVVSLAGREVQLTPTEYDLLRVLIADQGRVLTHHQLLTRVWGEGFLEDIQVLRVNVSNLRKKIEPDPRHPQLLVTEPGVGYRLRIL